MISNTQITAVTPAGTAGAANVVVTTTGGTTTGTNLFTYIYLPNPAKDPEVIGLVNMQEHTAQQFWQAQVFNFQRHLESLHHSVGTSSVPNGSGVTNAGDSPTAGRPNQLSAPIQLAENTVASDVPSAASVLYKLASAVKSSSLNVNLASLGKGKPVSAPTGGNDLNVWGAGNVRLGTQKQQTGNSNVDYTTNGVSLGVDKRINEHLILGLGVGYGHDNSSFGSNGTENTSNGYNLTVYGSYQPVTTIYVDGLLGYGTLRMGSNRYVTLSGGTAHSDRTGSQLYGALITGYEYHHDKTLVSPYVRYVFGEDRLAAVNETGAGIYSLNYGSQTFRNQQAMLALRVASQYDMISGTMSPHARIGYKHQFTGSSQSTVAYANFISTRYSLAMPTNNTDSILLGAGSSFALQNGLNIDLGYQWESASGGAVNQAIYARLDKGF